VSLVVRRTENEEPQITFHPGCCGFLVFIAAPRGFATLVHIAAAGCVRRFRSRARQEGRTGASGCLDHRGHSDHVGVRLRGNRLFRTAARRRRKGRGYRGKHRSWRASAQLALSFVRSARAVRAVAFVSLAVPNVIVKIAAVGCRRAALRVVRNAVPFAGVLSEMGSFERPSNSRMEPARPMVLCDPVAAARGSFGNVSPSIPRSLIVTDHPIDDTHTKGVV